MPIQTTYSLEHIKGFEGQRADFGLMNNFSKVCDESSGIAYGRAVVRGDADNQAKLPSGTGQSFLGFTNQTTAGQANTSNVHLYERYRSMNVMDIGPIYLYTETSVQPGDAVFYRHTASGGNTVIGRVRNDADSNTCDEVKYATFEESVTAGNIVLVWLRGNETQAQLFESITATSGALSIKTLVSQFDTTAGASTSTLADGIEGQTKILEMIVDGGDMVVTPANLFDGTTLTFTRVGDTATLLFTNGAWHVISLKGVQGLTNSVIEIINPSLQAITAAGASAISLVTNITTFDTTAGAQTGTLADGEEGQKKLLKMVVDGGTDMVVTPSNLLDGTTLTFADVNDSCELIFINSSWNIISNNGVVIA